MSMRQRLLNLVFEQKEDYVSEVGQREFDCLVALVEDGTISTFKQLAEHGIVVLTGRALLESYVSMFESGSQGCDMDYQAAQALAVAIKELLDSTGK